MGQLYAPLTEEERQQLGVPTGGEGVAVRFVDDLSGRRVLQEPQHHLHAVEHAGSASNRHTEPKPNFADAQHGTKAPGIELLGQFHTVDQNNDIACQQDTKTEKLVDPEHLTLELLRNTYKTVMLVPVEHYRCAHKSRPDKGRSRDLLGEIRLPVRKAGKYLVGSHQDKDDQCGATNNDLNLLHHTGTLFQTGKQLVNINSSLVP